MTSPARIYLKVLDGLWHADHRDASGQPVSEIVNLFGTSLLPTPFAGSTDWRVVYGRITTLNPGVTVMVVTG